MKSCTPRRRPVLSRGAPKACGGALVLMGITCFAAISLAQKSGAPSESEAWQRPAGLTAEEVLSSPRLLSVASQALLKTMKQQESWEASLYDATTSSDAAEELVNRTVQETFSNISATLTKLHVAEELDSFSLTEGQLEAICSAIEHIADPRVQEIGSTLAKALKRYFDVEDDRAGKEGMKLHLLRTLEPQMVEIRRLWREVKMGFGPNLGWSVTVDPTRLFLVRSFKLFKTRSGSSKPKLCDSLAACVAEASREEGRTLLLQMQALLTTFGMRLEVMQILGQRGESFNPLAQLIACPSADEDDMEPFQRMSCALRYGATGLDVMSSIRGSSPTS